MTKITLETIRTARAVLARLCSEGGDIKMSIPVRPDTDEDFILEAIFAYAQQKLQEEDTVTVQYVDAIRPGHTFSTAPVYIGKATNAPDLKYMSPIQDEDDQKRALLVLTKLLDAVIAYMPPDGTPYEEFIGSVIGMVDPWPLEKTAPHGAYENADRTVKTFKVPKDMTIHEAIVKGWREGKLIRRVQ